MNNKEEVIEEIVELKPLDMELFHRNFIDNDFVHKVEWVSIDDIKKK